VIFHVFYMFLVTAMYEDYCIACRHELLPCMKTTALHVVSGLGLKNIVFAWKYPVTLNYLVQNSWEVLES